MAAYLDKGWGQQMIARKLNSFDLRGNSLACVKCRCPQQPGSMFLVPFDTEKQLPGPPDRPLLCPRSLILEPRQARLALNALLFLFLAPLLYSHEHVRTQTPPRRTEPLPTLSL